LYLLLLYRKVHCILTYVMCIFMESDFRNLNGIFANLLNRRPGFSYLLLIHYSVMSHISSLWKTHFVHSQENENRKGSKNMMLL
jgi:hypothetical protein